MELVTLFVVIGSVILKISRKTPLVGTLSIYFLLRKWWFVINPPDTPVPPVAAEIVATGVELLQIVRDKLCQQSVFAFVL